jgi:outer membrane receptor protein involved in Fe transport
VVSQTSLFNKEYENFQDISQIALDGQVPLMGGATYNKSKGFSQELRALSPDDGSPWKWIAGAVYYRLNLFDCAEVAVAEDLPLDLAITPLLDGVVATPCRQNAGKIEGQVNIAHLLGDLVLTEHAFFGEVTRELGEQWELTAGARLYRTESGGTVETAGALYSAQNGGMPSSHDAASRQQGISPKVSIVYHPLPELRGYFTASRGFRFGGPQLGASTPTTEVPETYKSDSLWNYELGLRSDWFDRSLRIDASAYYIDWKDPQVNQRSNDSLAVFITNVGGVEGKGVDLSLRYLPPFAHGLSLTSNMSWNDTKTTAAFDDVSGNPVPSGSPWPNAPHWQASTTLAYALPLESWGASAYVRHNYIGPACNAINCTGTVFDYNSYDLNFSVFSLSQAWLPELSLSVENLTDERAINASSQTEIAGSVVDIVNYVPPRAVVLRLSGKF